MTVRQAHVYQVEILLFPKIGRAEGLRVVDSGLRGVIMVHDS